MVSVPSDMFSEQTAGETKTETQQTHDVRFELLVEVLGECGRQVLQSNQDHASQESLIYVKAVQSACLREWL
jgi:hypothetical protein